MRLSDAVFTASDDFHISRLRPLYELMLRNGFGHLDQPRFRCDVDNAEMSVIELNVTALTPSGELIALAFDHNERNLFQNVAMPTADGPAIVWLEIVKGEFDTFTDRDIPFRDNRYRLQVRPEASAFTSPDAVPVARFEYRQCWMMDSSFIAPCLTVRANTDLWNKAHLLLRTLKELIAALQQKRRSEMGAEVVALVPVLTIILTELEREADSMSPKRLLTLMQQAVGAVTATCSMSDSCSVPEPESCARFVSQTYVPSNIDPMVSEGIRLLQLLVAMTGGFSDRIPEAAPAPLPPEPDFQRPAPRPPRTLDTSSERKSFKSRR